MIGLALQFSDLMSKLCSHYCSGSMLINTTFYKLNLFLFRWSRIMLSCHWFICTLCCKKRPTLWLSISLSNINWFSKFFHWCILQTISNKVIIKYATTRLLCCYTTLWNINARKTNSSRQQACWWTKYTSEQKCSEWSVRCYTLLDSFL